MKQQKGFLLISLLIGIAIIAIIIFAGQKDGSGEKKNKIEQGRSAVQSAEEARAMLEQRNRAIIEQ